MVSLFEQIQEKFHESPKDIHYKLPNPLDTQDYYYAPKPIWMMNRKMADIIPPVPFFIILRPHFGK